MAFSSCLICHTAPAYQNCVSITKTATFNPLGPLGAPFKKALERFKHNIRPLLDNGLKGDNYESPERASLCLCFFVCLSVTKLQVTVFDPVTYFF